jgi:cell division protein FtsB
MYSQDVEQVKYSNEALLDRNLDLKEELSGLRQHSDLLTSQNRDLQ